jgi:hypothetical protein
MRTSPSIAPHGPEQDTYIVLDDFGRSGRSWCEIDEHGTDRETLIRDLMSGQYNSPVRIVAFNTVEGWPAGHQHPQHYLPALARLAETGKPVSGPVQ